MGFIAATLDDKIWSVIGFMNELDYYLIDPQKYSLGKPCFYYYKQEVDGFSKGIKKDPQYLTIEEAISLHNSFYHPVKESLTITLHAPRKVKKLTLNAEQLNNAINAKYFTSVDIKWSKRKQKIMENIREEV